MAIAPLLLNGAFGGISDDKFAWTQNSYQEIVGLNVRDNPKSVTASKSAIKDTWSVVTDHVLCAITVRSTWDILAFGDTGKIYRKASGGSWALCYTHSPAVKITNAIEYNGYVYWATSTKLHRHSVAGISNSLSPDLNWGTFSVGSDYHPMCVYQGNLFIGDGWKLSSIMNTVWTFNPAHKTTDNEDFTYDKTSVITHITQNGASVRMYLKWARWAGTVIYTDTFDLSNDQVQNFQQADLVVTKWTVDYVLSNDELHYYPFQAQVLKKVTEYSDNQNAACLHKGRIYFGTPGGVYCWGSLNKNYAECLTLEHKTSNNDAIANVWCVFSDGNDLYFSWYTVVSGNTVYGIDKVWTTRWTGYLVTRAYFGSYIMQEKINHNYLVSFKKLGVGDSIKIYAKYNEAASFTLQYTIDSTKYSGNFAKIPVKWDFHTAEIKVEVTGNAELYELLLDYGIKWI